MNISITKRGLTVKEIGILSKEIAHFPDLSLVDDKLWSRYETYVLTIDNRLAGICAVKKLEKFVKIGPIAVLEKYQGKGYGKLLFKSVVNRYKKYNIYIGSSNSRVKMMVKKAGFKKLENFRSLPREIKIYLLKYLFDRMNIDFILDDLKKRLFYRKDKYWYFLSFAQSVQNKRNHHKGNTKPD